MGTRESRSAFDRRPSPGRRLRPALSRCRAGLTVDPGPREGAGTRALDAATRHVVSPSRWPHAVSRRQPHMIPKGGGRRRQTAAWRQRGHGSCQQLAQDKGKRQRQRAGQQASRPSRPSGGQRRHGTLCQAPPEPFHVATQAPCDSLEMRTAGGRAARRDNQRPRPPMDGPRTHGPCSAVPQLSIPVPLKLDVTARLLPVCLPVCHSASPLPC
jgi:hypothetical protein